MNIIIPMAGMGKRMRPHTLTTPKPLIPIAGKPIVQRLVEDIIKTVQTPVQKIAFIISPTFGKETEDLLHKIAQNVGAEAVICYQTEALGTAHAIMCAKECLEKEVFIAFADTLFDAQFKIDMNKDAVIWTQSVEDPSQFGVVRLDDNNQIVEFVEKPSVFVSNLAIIGVYYFKDGPLLRSHLQYLLDNDIKKGNEYQLTDAMENMRQEGIPFYTDVVTEWLDCGNKNATVYTNQRVLELKKDHEHFIHESVQINNSTIIPPVYLGEHVQLDNSIIGPHVSIESNTQIKNSIINNSIIMKDSIIEKVNLTNSMIGQSVQYSACSEDLNIGDYTVIKK